MLLELITWRQVMNIPSSCISKYYCKNELNMRCLVDRRGWKVDDHPNTVWLTRNNVEPALINLKCSIRITTGPWRAATPWELQTKLLFIQLYNNIQIISSSIISPWQACMHDKKLHKGKEKWPEWGSWWPGSWSSCAPSSRCGQLSEMPGQADQSTSAGAWPA